MTDSKRPSRRRRQIVWVLAIVVLVGVLAFVPAGLLTDRPSFCKTCHGMVPFYDAWAQGPHKNTWCIDCHVDAGIPNRFLHKFAALSEVYAEVTTHATYPNYNADVPNARCLRCHEGVQKKVVGKFDHRMHLSKGLTCAKCHAATGHKVTFTALDAAGVLNKDNAPAGASYIGQKLQVSTGSPSVLAGHAKVICSNCHDQANLQCSFCHTPPIGHFKASCKLCHKPTTAFKDTVFNHPSAGEHNYRSRPCVACHPSGGSRVFCTCHKGKPPSGD